MINNMITWASSTLEKFDYKIIDEPIHILSTPWSIIIKFKTDKGDFYLKKVIKALLIEANIIQMIDDLTHDNVPNILSVNHDLQCFLMTDCGVNLRHFFKQKFNPDLYTEAFKKYTLIQRAMIKKTDALIDLDVPDWRLNNFSHLYLTFLNKEDFIDSLGITYEEKISLRECSSKISAICEELETYQIQAAFDQCDFQDNNMLLNPQTQKITFIDLGESVISHPFFPLHTCLFNAVYCGFCKENDSVYAQLKMAYLENFKDLESENNLLKIFDLTRILLPLYYVFCVERLIHLCRKESFRSDFVNSHGILKTLEAEKENIPDILRNLKFLNQP